MLETLGVETPLQIGALVLVALIGAPEVWNRAKGFLPAQSTTPRAPDSTGLFAVLAQLKQFGVKEETIFQAVTDAMEHMDTSPKEVPVEKPAAK